MSEEVVSMSVRREAVCQSGVPVCRNETSPLPGLPRASGGERGMKGIFGKSVACLSSAQTQPAEVEGPLIFAGIPKPPAMNLP